MLTVKNKTVFYASKGRPFSDFFFKFLCKCPRMPFSESVYNVKKIKWRKEKNNTVNQVKWNTGSEGLDNLSLKESLIDW